jgi:hypothetical protein
MSVAGVLQVLTGAAWPQAFFEYDPEVVEIRAEH